MSNILHSQGSNDARSDVLAHVAGNLKRLRAAAGLSQQALATRSGISRRMIAGVETGEANISLSSLDKIAAALHVGFVDLVRDPDTTSPGEISAVTWRGSDPSSLAVLLGSAPARQEAQMWIWSLAAGETYRAEPDPEGWHEMIFVIEGVLQLVRSGESSEHPAGRHVIFPTSQPYSYANPGNTPLRFLRNVIS